MDCDNTHPPRLIPGMLEKINADRDVVIASRFQPGAKVMGGTVCGTSDSTTNVPDHGLNPGALTTT